MRAAGYALPMALVLLVVLALLLTQALGGAAGEAALAANQQFRQAAFEAAEGGLVAARAAITMPAMADAAPPLPTAPLERTVDGGSAERSSTEVVHISDEVPPVGYSLDRFVLQRLELRSTGRAARGATVTLVEGVDRLGVRP